MAYLRNALFAARKAAVLAQAAADKTYGMDVSHPCAMCQTTGRPLFGGVCTPCEDREQAHQRLDGRAMATQGRSRASMARTYGLTD